MKTSSLRLRSSTSVVAALTLGLLIFVPVQAAPNGVPPAGNVDANFSSVSTGIITNPNGNVSVKDSQGLYVMDDPGANGFQVLPNGDFYTIVSNVNNGQPVKQGNITNTVVNNGGAAGAALTAPFQLNNASNQNVFNLDSNGYISNPGLVQSGGLTSSPPVTVNDAEGLQIGTEPSVLIKEDGKVWGISDIIGPVKFSDKLAIDGAGSISNVNTGAGGYGGLNYPNWPVTIDDDFQVGTQFKVTKTTGDVAVSGHMKVAGGVGTYTTRTNSVSVNANSNAGVTVPCLGGEQVISCGYTNSVPFNGNWSFNYMYPTATGCNIGGKNNTAATHTLTGSAVCFHPNL